MTTHYIFKTISLSHTEHYAIHDGDGLALSWLPDTLEDVVNGYIENCLKIKPSEVSSYPDFIKRDEKVNEILDNLDKHKISYDPPFDTFFYHTDIQRVVRLKEKEIVKLESLLNKSIGTGMYLLREEARRKIKSAVNR